VRILLCGCLFLSGYNIKSPFVGVSLFIFFYLSVNCYIGDLVIEHGREYTSQGNLYEYDQNIRDDGSG